MTFIQLYDSSHAILTVDTRLKDAVHHIIPHHGWNIQIKSNIPFSSGMGSSAAFGICIATKLWSQAQAEVWTDEIYLQKAHEIECFFHGTPSGIDHTVIFHDACIWFKSIHLEQSICTNTKIPDLHLVVIHSQIKGNTKEQVEKVRQRIKENKPIIENMGKCTEAIHECLGRLYQYKQEKNDLSKTKCTISNKENSVLS